MTDSFGQTKLGAPSGSEYDTGVSNGDVDWLFRGKSKKLTKKMNSTVVDKEKKLGDNEKSREEKKSEDKQNDQSTSEVKMPLNMGRSQDSSKAPKEKEPATEKYGKSNKTTNLNRQKDTSSAKETLHNTIPHDNIDAANNEKSNLTSNDKFSMLDKFRLGRTRSSSTSSVNADAGDPLLSKSGRQLQNTQQPQQEKHLNHEHVSQESSSARRRSSLGFGSDRSNPSSEGEVSPGVSRSNSSGGKTRSLLSSISSKFKSNGDSSASTVNSASNQTPHTPKFNPHLIGSGSTPSHNQDLATVMNRPPSGVGIPSSGKRRNSSGGKSSSSPDASLDKEKGKFFRRESVSSGKSQNSRVVLNKNSKRDKIPIKELDNLNLRRVNFAIDKLLEDPQQQIPSRRPKKGNVLIPDDILAPSPRLCQGISSSDGSKMNSGSENKYSEKELQAALESHKRALIEADKHAQEAHLSANRIAQEVRLFRCKSGSLKSQNGGEDFENEADYDDAPGTLAHDVADIEIDKPLHTHENYFENSEEPEEENIDNITLESIYTRCCHLREILPIPATLKQLKNKSKPLQVLKLLNPKPTLIDALSFSDFIAITPIYTVIFDNVTVTTEMLMHFLSSLVNNTTLEKLSLRNVAIDEIGWKYLCKFLSKNKTIKKLDISQQRIKSDTKANSVRSSMNWDLFIESLIIRGGIEELVINGCKLSDEAFKSLIERAVKLSTYRLGIASTELNLSKAKIVAEWITEPDSKCVGVDLAFNDLTKGQLRPFIEPFNKGKLKLLFFSLNSTHLSDVEEASQMIEALSHVKTLRFLDLSSLPQLFPSIISSLNKYLPRFESLKRIHFDLNELSSQSIVAIADILPKIKTLVHVSFLGNRDLSNTAAATLYTAVKLSDSIFALDLDYDLISDDLAQRIAFYLMRNMDKTLNSEINYLANHDNEEELMYDGSLLMETAEKLLSENDKSKDKKEDLKLQKILTNAMMERGRAVRKDIHKIIDSLFERRNQGTLSLEGKENLLRLCLLDASLEKVVHTFEEQAKLKGFFSSSQKTESTSSSSNADQSRPEIKTPLSRESLHQSSNELITAGHILSPRSTTFSLQSLAPPTEQNFQPHQVVIDSMSDGKDIPIDNLTGRPVLMRSSSHASSHAKEQEMEEGELHRWGFFIQQRNNSSTDLNTNRDNTQSQMSKKPLSVISDTPEKQAKDIPHLPVLPSGSELRDAIIAAKGIESVTDLIDKINNNRVSIDKIYNIPEKPSKKESSISSPNDDKNHSTNSDEDDNISIDSEYDGGDDAMNAVVDEAYDKILNDAQRVRSNK
ncbi:uncharacterized protein PRCAT00000602001 [Priceomyces carsonii]|uniref:uncharacterized protein n=1 Tax=Priceomyces carsonii TaxID=28549 RepID=UPI002ED9AE3E|nr:unnamed protein product [Priceomyces carsonii]